MSSHISRLAFSSLAVTALGSPAHAARATHAGGIYTGMDNCPLSSPAMKNPTNLRSAASSR